RPQRAVGLDRRRVVGWTTQERRPGAVLTLLGADPVRRQPRLFLGADAEEVAQEEILGIHGHVRLELALPPAGVVLEREQMRHRTIERLRDCSVHLGLRDSVHAATRSFPAAPLPSAARAAARPLRTAPSMVAGQPVSVQAPARNRPGMPVTGPGRCAAVPGTA